MTVEVHLDWQGQTSLVRHLHAAEQSSTNSFEYASQWLERRDAFAIDPTSLPLQPGGHHHVELFGAIQDCGPDRWGRILIERAARKKILSQKPYRTIDYVLALDDTARVGALRLRLNSKSPFLAETSGRLPPLLRLGALLRATDAIHAETETADDLRFLLGAGSPLGGARPKAAVVLADERLAIAKFPKPDDTRDIGAGEILCLTLAAQAGITAAEHRLVPVGAQSVALITRFDRDGMKRLPFISASSLTGLSHGEQGSYTLLADGIRRFGDNISDDLREMWRRLVFSLLASNHDDHLRNHGFLMHRRGRWSLSPAYDINPVPESDRVHLHQTAITDAPEESSIDKALAVAPRFGVKITEAKKILREVFTAVSGWRKTGRRLRLKSSTLDAYASAFEHTLMEEARQIVDRT